ncbi:hypothetical protein [Aeromicrobium sp.]|uniref:hypothetical protein n=1 Tax=Aeromicrobium sp. TaxID=1871063 RepID=UPI003C43A8C9
MTTTTMSTEITQFAERVRAELADLPDDDLEDLTDGLEADLAESLDEDPTRELPDPIAYAIELRTAAGLPPRAEPGRGVGGAFRGMTSGLRAAGHQTAESLRGNPVTGAVLDFAAALRPVWWVLRAWVVFWLVAAFFGSEAGLAPQGLWWVVLAALVVLSVQLGRGQWRAGGVPTLVVIGNVLALIVLLPVLGTAASWHGSSEEVFPASEPAPVGTTLNGRPVTNMYAYGADGKPLTGVQLFDQDGAPLVPYVGYQGCVDGSCDEGGGFLPQDARLETGETAQNVYPRKSVRGIYNENGDLVPDPSAQQRAQKPPFIQVPRVVDEAQKVD